ncbi:MAG: class I adenylate-forming enzyme family protein [Pseudomonadota bacterium]
MHNVLSHEDPAFDLAPAYRPLGSLLDEYRMRDPDRTALVDVEQDRRISFGQLAAAVDSIGIQLCDLGISKGSRVILLAEDSIEKIVLWLAIWRLAAVVCPLDLKFIGAAADATVNAIRPALVICSEHLEPSALAGKTGAPVVRFGAWTAHCHARDGMLSFGAQASQDRLHELAPAAAHDIASLACTSGTTGSPKIVVYDHAALWHNGCTSVDLLGLDQHDRMLEFRSLNWYSAQILSLLPFLQTGLTLHLARRFSRSRLLDWIDSYRITVSVGVPTVINILMQEPAAGAAARLVSLRAITCSSAPLSTTQWTRFEQTYGVQLYNLYGTSEAGWICGNRHGARKLGTVGRPVDNIRFRIVDQAGMPCNEGEEGEVVVSGAKLAVGLLQHDGSITPIRGTPLKTHDLAIADGEGYVRITGRIDDLIIRGGVKISGQEISEVLLAHPGVLEAVVVGVPDPIYGAVPVCFIVPKITGTPDESELLAHCARQLAREKVPARAFVVAQLPQNERGKILRGTLRSEWWNELRHQAAL